MAIISSFRKLSSQEAVIVSSNHRILGIKKKKEKKRKICSYIIPSQKIVFLGYVIDSVEMTVSLPGEKVNMLKEQTLALWEKPRCSTRELAHVIGFIVPLFPPLNQQGFATVILKSVN